MANAGIGRTLKGTRRAARQRIPLTILPVRSTKSPQKNPQMLKSMAGLRDLRRLWAISPSSIVDLQRTAGLLAALRCVSTCVLTSQPLKYDILEAHRVTLKHRHFSTRESSDFDAGHGVEGVPVFQRTVPRTHDEFQEMRLHPCNPPQDARILKVSIVGAPNAGKSTLTNALMGWRICSVSKKVHTTKHNTKAILVEGNTQILFVDTPGLISEEEKKRHNLENTMLYHPKLSIHKADLVLVLVDVSNKFTRNKLDYKVLKLLEKYEDKKVVLVLNKIDMVKSKEILLGIVRDLTEGNVDGTIAHRVKQLQKPKDLETIFKQTEKLLKDKRQDGIAKHQEPEIKFEDDQKTKIEGLRFTPHFSSIFMLSALSNDGVSELKAHLFREAKQGSWAFSPSFVTDQKPEEIVKLAVREKLLDYMPQEIPYNIALEIEHWEVDATGVLRISVLAKCPMKHQVKLVIGPRGEMVSKIAAEARQMLMNTFRCEVSLKLIVDCDKSKKK